MLSNKLLYGLFLPIVSLHRVSATHRDATDSPGQNPLYTPPVIRNATPDDASAITDILIDAWWPAPEQKYIFQFREQHPQYHWKCVKYEVDQFLGQELDDVIIHVIDASISEGSSEMKAVSVAAWELMSPETTNRLPSVASLMRNCSDHRDLNFTRAIHWDKEFTAYYDRYIDEAYESQVYLHVLGTHPDFDGRGFGAAQVEWGKGLARDRGENVTLIATPAGYALYRTIEFQEIANLTFTKVGGEFLTWFEVMVYDIERRRS